MTRPDTTQSCPYSPHSGPVGCLPAPNIFPLEKETFAQGKMFYPHIAMWPMPAGGAANSRLPIGSANGQP